MRKISKLMAIVGIGLLIAVGVSAQEDVQGAPVTSPTKLIDFADLIEGGNAPVLDFDQLVGNLATSLFSEAERAAIQASLAIYPREQEADNRWRVELTSSSRRPEAVRRSGVLAVPARRTVEGFVQEGENVLGVRIFFPDGNFNGWALLRPPFSIPFSRAEGRNFEGFGIIDNVGEIEYIDVRLYGLNHPHGVSVVLEDQDRNQREYFVGYINTGLPGWQTLRWENGDYLANVNKRTFEQAPPLYPNFATRLRFVGLRFYRSSEFPGGDLITYIKDIRVGYERQEAIEDPDFDHEDEWQIEALQNTERQRLENRQLSNTEVLRLLEFGKQRLGAQ